MSTLTTTQVVSTFVTTIYSFFLYFDWLPAYVKFLLSSPAERLSSQGAGLPFIALTPFVVYVVTESVLKKICK